MLANSSKICVVHVFFVFVLSTVGAQAAEPVNTIEFNIRQQPLANALLDFSYQSDVQLIMPSALAADLIADEVVGAYTLQEALTQLLENTGLRYEFTGERTVTIKQMKQSFNRVDRRRKRFEQLGLEQMYVRGEKSQEQLADSTVSRVALSGEDLESRGVKNADELQQFVPGLTVESPQTTNTEFSIRGAGISNNDLGTASGVAVYVDDIYIPRQSVANMAIYELDRVEVLRGPQSTLYAQNSTGGSIIYVTRKPSADFEARYLVEAGNYNHFINLLTVNGEMKDGLLAQLALASYKRDPVMKNVQPLVDGNNIDSDSGRLAFRVVKSEKLEWLLSLDIESREQDAVLYSIGPDGPFQFAAGLPTVEPSDSPRSVEVDTPGGENLETLGLMTRLNIQKDSHNFSLIIGRRSHSFKGLYDLDQTPQLLVNEALAEDSDLSSLELRWSSAPLAQNNVPGSWKWKSGILALQEKAEFNKSYQAPVFSADMNHWGQSLEQQSYSVYGDIQYHLSHSTSLSAGLRYLADIRAFQLTANSSNPEPGNVYLSENFKQQDKRAWRRLTPRLAANFQVSPDTSFYVSAASGYKPGGFGGTPHNLLSAGIPYLQERVISYEMGMRSSWIDNRIKMNSAIYSADYRDMQIFTHDAVGKNIVQNAERATTRGFEVELQVRLVTSLQIGLGMSFIDAKFDRFLYEDDGRLIDKSGDRVPRIPAATLNLSVAYLFPDTPLGSWSIRADTAYSGDAKNINNDLAWLEHRKYSLWFDYLPHNGKWELSLWVRNLRDNEYFQASSPGISNGNNAFARKLEPPRISGLSLKYFW